MAVVENAAINVVGSSNPGRIVQKDVGLDHQSVKTKQNNSVQKSKVSSDQNFEIMSVNQQQQQQQEPQKGNEIQQEQHSVNGNGVLGNHSSQHEHPKMNGVDSRNGGSVDGEGGDEGFKKEMRDLEEMLSKLNPMAEEFVPPSMANNNMRLPFPPGTVHFGFDANNFLMQTEANGNSNRRKKNGYGYGRRRMNTRTGMAQREDVIRRTVYVSDIDHQVTEEQLAALFLGCGQVVDCRICGDTNSVLRFAFIEFTDEEGARSALSLAGTMLGFYPVRVLPSKTAIAPVNPTFLPRSEDEREMCARTVYCTNIDKKVTQADVKLFFESFCGEVYRLRLLGDYHHSTRIAFVEFVMAESAIAALNCSGAILGSLPIRVSPSKTPVRPRFPR
ncbi:polyadenylate-binding protein-interacting protein 12-like [Solanum dulcamara]|uniref:polyadenylate-binding protein-interacting protein 12-like n=1 Tax=Solanum dulcamara TaxID=45834 RepID=UPI0024866894|nr:polyadenylate-binding protein-interacting protein 12-like [Solanum dulcamara]